MEIAGKRASDYHKEIKGYQKALRAKTIPAENWMAEKLKMTPYKWTRQAIWTRRIFDFWSAELGVAIEIDGPGHKEKIDAWRDAYNYVRSGIVVLRVRNFNEQDAEKCLAELATLGIWSDRRAKLGLTAPGGKRKNKRIWRQSKTWQEAVQLCESGQEHQGSLF